MRRKGKNTEFENVYCRAIISKNYNVLIKSHPLCDNKNKESTYNYEWWIPYFVIQCE